MKKILITGASGFIGDYIINYLLNHFNYKIIATDINMDKAKTKKWFHKVNFISCDLNEKKTNYFEYFEQPDLLIHLSWEGLPHYKELFHIERNLTVNYFFLKNMIEHGLKNISIAGTCFEYGLINGMLSEEIEPRPVTSYALAKDSLRKFIEILNQKYDFQFKWLRIFYMFGEGQSKSSILELLKDAIKNKQELFNMSGGEQLRDYLPIELLAEYIVKISIQNTIHGIVNCCSGQPISIRKLVENYLNSNNQSIKLNLGYYPYPDYEPMAFWGCTQKMKLALNSFEREIKSNE